MNQSTHLKYKYDSSDPSVCFHWLSCMTFALVMTGSSRLKKMFRNLNRIMRTTYSSLGEKVPEPQHSGCTTLMHISRVMILLTYQGTAVFLAPLFSTRSVC